MANNTKLKIKKVATVNPKSHEKGFTTRVITNGTADYEAIVEQGVQNTTVHKAEAKTALELCMESAAKYLRQGYIIDLGPLGKIYPSCSSKWTATANEQLKDNVKPSLYYRPADDIAAAIKGAQLQWTTIADEEAEADGTTTADNSTPDDNDGDGIEP